MDSIVGIFHIDWKIMLAQALNFGVVFLVLYFFALKPLMKVMRERTEKIEKGISDAKKSDDLLRRAAEEYEKNSLKIRQASIEAQKNLERELEEMRKENLLRIKADNNEWERKRTKQMEDDKNRLVEEARRELVLLAKQMAEKIIEEKEAKT